MGGRILVEKITKVDLTELMEALALNAQEEILEMEDMNLEGFKVDKIWSCIIDLVANARIKSSAKACEKISESLRDQSKGSIKMFQRKGDKIEP
jgi:hypothetical protein